MFPKTRISEKTKTVRTPDTEDKKSYSGKTLPAVAPAQLAAEEELPMQGKFDPVQKMEEEEPLQGKFETMQKVEEEEPLQGKFDPVQKMEEEEPLQGKFETMQKVEEEEPLQGKFDPIQKMEEEEPLQGKFETMQKVEEEEPLQGKFDPVQKMEEEETLQGKFETMQKVEEEEPLQGKFEPIQKMEEEEPLQGKFDPAGKTKSDTVQKKKSGAKPFQLKTDTGAGHAGLPANLKTGIESLSGFSMNDVKVHYNSSKPKQMKAHAYAQGTDIHIAPGEEQHLPHEAWHVAQQKQGRVQPTIQMKEGVPVNDDAGLEHEADVMGAKAVTQGKEMEGTAQLKFNSNLISGRRSVQRKAINTRPVQLNGRGRGSSVMEESAEAKFQRENAPIISMITNASNILGEINWATLAAGTDTVGTVASVGGLAGSLTSASGSATNTLKGETGPDLSKAAGDITAGVGSSIGSLVKTVMAIKTLYATAKGSEGKLVGGGETAIAIMAALKSGCEAAMSIQKYVNGSVPPGLKSLIPGLGIAIAACEVIVNAYSMYNAYSAEAEMSSVSGEFRADLAAIFGGNPETAAPSLFANEKRGKFGNRITYLRLKPGLFESLDSIMDRGITSQQKAQRATNFKRTHGLMGTTATIDQICAAIKYYELGSKMQEINQKRKVQGARNIFTNLLAIAGEIAKFFPADGGITAGVLLGASAAIGAAQSAGKFIQGLARNNGVLGGDTNRSDTQKHKEYVNHTRTIYEYMSAIDPVSEANKAKVQRSDQLVRSTGVNISAVYATEYENTTSKKAQVNLIVDSMKAGR